MALAELLNIQRGLTAITGSGGKTTLLYALARELSAEARVIVCTTTATFTPRTGFRSCGRPTGMRCKTPSIREIRSASAAGWSAESCSRRGRRFPC